MSQELICLNPRLYAFPNPTHPCYHLSLTLDPRPSRDLTVRQVRVDGQRVRDFWLYSDRVIASNNVFPAGMDAAIVVRLDWQNDSTHRVELDLENPDGNVQTLVSDSTAPHWGGYWDPAWRYYASIVVREDRGIPRVKEPVHVLLGVYADRLADPAREARVVAVDPESGVAVQVPSQVYDVSSQSAVRDEKGQPTTTFKVAFLADVPAHTGKVYLIFYGNPAATAPTYVTDLTVSGEGLARVVENSYYQIKLHPKSGAVDEILLKQGVNALFAHHIETNGALFWNPDVYAPPRVWTHASDWDPPQGYSTISGPIFFMTKRWGALPDYPDVDCSVTYLFHAYQPYMLMDSNVDILQDLDVRALRNGEIVTNLDVVREFAWKQADGEIGVLDFSTRPREPARVLDLPITTPWWAFINRERRASLAALTLETSAVRRRDGPVHMEPCVILKWGPWVYCTRPLVQTNNTANPQRLVRVPAGSSFGERMAIYPGRLGATEQDRFAAIDAVYEQLVQPLYVAPAELDLDARTPEKWGPTFPAPGAVL